MGYICIECGRTFDEPSEYREYHDEIGGGAHEVFYVCPHCESANYEPTVKCTVCDEEVGKTQGTYGLCPDCEQDTENRFKGLLADYFTKNELEFLSSQYEGRWLNE